MSEPKRNDSWLYQLIQLSPCIILSVVVVLVQPNYAEYGITLALALGFAGLLAYLAPKQHRLYATGLAYCCLLVLILLSRLF